MTFANQNIPAPEECPDPYLIGTVGGNQQFMDLLPDWTIDEYREFRKKNEVQPLAHFVFRNDTVKYRHLCADQRPRVRVKIKEVEELVCLFDIESTPQGHGMGRTLLLALRKYVDAREKMLVINKPMMTAVSQYRSWYSQFDWLISQSEDIGNATWYGLVYNPNGKKPSENLTALGLIGGK